MPWLIPIPHPHSPPGLWSSDLLVASEAGISFVFVLGINLFPVLDSACSQGEVLVIIIVACPLSSADWFLLMFWPPKDLGHTELEKWSKYGLWWTRLFWPSSSGELRKYFIFIMMYLYPFFWDKDLFYNQFWPSDLNKRNELVNKKNINISNALNIHWSCPWLRLGVTPPGNEAIVILWTPGAASCLPSYQ